MNDSLRYALYLIPPYPVSRLVMEQHQVLRKQFGLTAASRFQVHATVKGFFKKVEGLLDPLIESLDALFTVQKLFMVEAGDYRIDDVGIGYDCSCLSGIQNQELYAFRAKVVGAVRPYIASDCDFVASDLGKPYEAHITLAFRDIPLSDYDDVLAYLAQGPFPEEPFLAQNFHFLAFSSDDWSGSWWETLTWRLIKSWTLSNE